MPIFSLDEQYGPIFSAIGASTTTELVNSVVGSFTAGSALDRSTYAHAIFLEINGASTPNWTLAIQGKVSPGATYHNIDYLRVDQGGGFAFSSANLTVNWTTAQYYVIPNPPPFVQLVSTFTAGTLTVYGAMSAAPWSSVYSETEFAAAALAADATANPTVPGVLDFMHAFNGTTWDRARTVAAGDAAATGLLAAGNYNFNGTNWDRSQGVAIGDAAATGLPAVGLFGFSGSFWDRLRSGADNADAVAVATLGRLLANSRSYLFNGTTWDRARNNIDVTSLTSASRTTTQTSADITTYDAAGIVVTLDMTVVGTGSVTVTINYKDPASGKYILLLSGVAVTTNITSKYVIHPSVPAVANVSAQTLLGRIIQIVVTANNGNAATYSLGYTLTRN